MSTTQQHRQLEHLYAAAPVSQRYGSRITIGDGEAEVRLAVGSEFYHCAGGVHGSAYFRLLDDAAFFAANSRVLENLVLTVSFTVHFARPVSAGELRAVGRLLHQSGRLFMAEADLLDEAGQLLAHGSGVFTRSAVVLDPSIGYTT